MGLIATLAGGIGSLGLWAAFKENGFLFEALLPESDDEDLVWTVRISRGNEVNTHQMKLIWPPRSPIGALAAVHVRRQPQFDIGKAGEGSAH